MATNKDKLLTGIKFLALGFPFIFIGPALWTWQGVKGLKAGYYLWPILSIIAMLLAAFLCVKGIRTVMAALFDKDS